MDIRRLKRQLNKIKPRHEDGRGYKYIVVATDEAKLELLELAKQLSEQEQEDLIVITEAENSAGGMGVRSSGYKGQNRVSGWESSTYDYAADNNEIV